MDKKFLLNIKSCKEFEKLKKSKMAGALIGGSEAAGLQIIHNKTVHWRSQEQE